MSNKGGMSGRNIREVCSPFYVVLSMVGGLTLLSLAASLILAFSDPRPPHQETLQVGLFYACCGMWKMGVGVIFGLLGGRGIAAKRSVCSSFYVVLFMVAGVTVLALGVSLILSFCDPGSAHQEKVQISIFYACCAMWEMGVGVIFGLLGGKRIS